MSSMTIECGQCNWAEGDDVLLWEAVMMSRDVLLGLSSLLSRRRPTSVRVKDEVPPCRRRANWSSVTTRRRVFGAGDGGRCVG